MANLEYVRMTKLVCGDEYSSGQSYTCYVHVLYTRINQLVNISVYCSSCDFYTEKCHWRNDCPHAHGYDGYHCCSDDHVCDDRNEFILFSGDGLVIFLGKQIDDDLAPLMGDNSIHFPVNVDRGDSIVPLIGKISSSKTWAAISIDDIVKGDVLHSFSFSFGVGLPSRN